jgi:hypothetical protein
VTSAALIHVVVSGLATGCAIWSIGGAETPPPCPPRFARGRTTAENLRVTTAALIHVVVSGLATGCIYALMALSLVIIYNATRTLNFALALASRGYVLETGRVVAAGAAAALATDPRIRSAYLGLAPPRSDGPPGYDAAWRREGAP